MSVSELAQRMNTATTDLVDEASALQALGQQIHERVARNGYCHVNHPAELHHLQLLGHDALVAFARAHQLRVVPRSGGRAYDFTPLPG